MTPEVPGLYRVIATFLGSESYGSSSVTANVTAVEGNTPSSYNYAVTSPIITDTYFLPLSIGMLLAVIIAAIAIVLVLKKR